jgi:hypothetical protein
MNTPCQSFRRKVKTCFAPDSNLLESSGAAERFRAEKSTKDRAVCIPLDPSLPLLQQRRAAARSLCRQFAVPAESRFLLSDD